MKPLQGVRIVSVEQFGAGPYATMLLADLGAEVIKVENAAIGGDPARKTGPYMLGENDSEYFQVFNINKKSVALDLRGADGKSALTRLIASADALINNLPGEPDGPPSRIGAPSMVDQTTGLTAAVALLSGIIQARARGEGCDMDTCLLDVALHQLGYVASWYLNEGHVSTRQSRSAHYSVAPVQTFPTADGWVFIMCMTDKFFGELARVIGRPDLMTDARFGSPSSRQSNRAALTAIIDAELSKQTNAHWLGR